MNQTLWQEAHGSWALISQSSDDFCGSNEPFGQVYVKQLRDFNYAKPAAAEFLPPFPSFARNSGRRAHAQRGGDSPGRASEHDSSKGRVN